MFNLQPTLKGDLVWLRPLLATDVEALFAVASDPLIWEQHPVKDRSEPDGFRRFFDEAMTSAGALVAIDAKTQEMIGSSRFHGYDPKKRRIEIGWTFLARSHWGGRYNGEMKQLMLDHAFEVVDSVIFLIGPENWRSRRSVEKIGARFIGTAPNSGGRQSAMYELTTPIT